MYINITWLKCCHTIISQRHHDSIIVLLKSVHGCVMCNATVRLIQTMDIILISLYSVFQKSDAKIEITITATNLVRIRYPLAALIITFLAQTLQNSTKSTAQFLSNSCLKNGTQKQKFPIWESRLSSSYTILSVTVCAQSGRHLHRHLHVSCADRTFSAAAGLPVCRPCSVNLPQKSVQCWTRPVLVRKFLQQLSGTVTLTLP